MRIRRLELTSYGAVSGSALEIGPGLTVIHGPNESGKSTMSHAIGDLLWGLQPRRHPYAFLVNPSQLRLTATVVRSSEPTQELILTVDSRGCRGSDDAPVTPWWRNGPVATRDAWTTALSLDLARLRSGGRSVLDDGGDLASLLFRARTGVDVTQAIEVLNGKAESSYKRHGGAKKVRIRELVAAAEAARGATAAATSSAAQVTRLRAEAAGLEAVSQKADGWYKKQEIAHGEAQEAQRAWEPAASLRTARDRQDKLSGRGRVLDDVALDAYVTARRELTALTGQLAVVEDELENLDARVGELVVDESVLALAAAVDDLQNRQKLEKGRLRTLADGHSQLSALQEQLRTVVASLAPKAWDDASANASDARRATATGLLVPVDVADRIHRGARVLIDIEAEIRIEAGEVETALAHLTDLQTDEFDLGDHSELRETRAVRDRAWAEVREPWLTGALPDALTRARLAVDVDVRTRSADEASDHASADAQGTGRVLEVNIQLADRVAHLDKLRMEREGLTHDWTDLLAEAGVPSVLDPSAWEVRWAAVQELSGLLSQERELVTSLTTGQESATAYAADVLTAGAQLGIPDGDTWAVLPQAVRLVAEARTRETKVMVLREGREGTVRTREVLRGRQIGHDAVIAALQTGDDLVEVVERSRAMAQERDRAQTSLEQVRHAAQKGTDLEGLVSRLAHLDAVDLTAQEAESNRMLAETLMARDQAREGLLNARASLHTAERIGDAATMHGREIEAAELLAAEVAEYVQTRVMIIALGRLLDAEEPAHDTALLTHASSLVTRLTGGRVTGLSVQDRSGERRLRIEAGGLGEGVADELSEGTADQVFLALRLAGIRQMQLRAAASGFGTLPVVLDDILVNHDDRRTAVALEVLAEEARDQQILLMTHHNAVAEAARLTNAAVVSLA